MINNETNKVEKTYKRINVSVYAYARLTVFQKKIKRNNLKIFLLDKFGLMPQQPFAGTRCSRAILYSSNFKDLLRGIFSNHGTHSYSGIRLIECKYKNTIENICHVPIQF